MVHLEPIIIGAASALVVGFILALAGFYVRRKKRLHTRQGAEVLAGFTAFMGLVAMAGGMASLIRAG